MAQRALHDGPATFTTSIRRPQFTMSGTLPPAWQVSRDSGHWQSWQDQRAAIQSNGLSSTGKGILIGMLSAFG